MPSGSFTFNLKNTLGDILVWNILRKLVTCDTVLIFSKLTEVYQPSKSKHILDTICIFKNHSQKLKITLTIILLL